MDFKHLSGKAAERIKAVFSKDNRFFYGASNQQETAYQDAQHNPAQGAYANGYQQNYYQQPAAPMQNAQQAYQAPLYQQAQTQAYQAQPYQQPNVQQAAAYPPQQQSPAYNWQAAPQEPVYSQPQQPAQNLSPQQAQVYQQPMEQGGRNRRSAQYSTAPQAEDNIVRFPGAPNEQEPAQMDAYVVNITNIAGCRQAMTCLRKGQCTLVVMDQLIDKAEVRRYVDMLNGACFALGGTMTRLSLKVGFYILAPSGMMVYTDPVTASANAPARPQPQAPAQQPMPQQQYAYNPAQNQQGQIGMNPPPYAQAPNPYAPPAAAPQAPYQQDLYSAQGYAQ